MHRVTGLRLHNICQYSDFSCRLDAGLTAVVGPNGRGKTTLLRALAYGLTGLVDGSWGNQQDLQKDGTADVGWVSVSFTDGSGAETEVRRFSTSSIKFPDAVTRGTETLAVRRRKVDEYMEGVFGMPCALMFQVCWGRQGELSQLLRATPSMVSDFLARLFDMRRVERVRDALKRGADSVARLSPVCLEDLEKARADLAALPDPAELSRQADGLQPDIDRTERAYMAARSAEEHGMQKDEKELELRTLKAQESAFEALAEGADPDAKAPSDRDRNEAMASLQSVRDTINSWRSRRSEIAALLDGAWEDIRKLEEERSALVIGKQERLKALRGGDEGVCRLCGGHVSDRDAYAANACELVTGFRTVAEYEADVDSKAAEKRGKADGLRDAVKAFEAEDRELKAQLDQLEPLEPQLAEGVADADRLRARDELARVRREYARLASIPVLDASIRADALEGELSDLRLRQTSLRERAAEAQASKELLERAVAQGERDASAYELSRNVVAALSELRDAMSQPRAQARYLRSRIDRLNQGLARYLEETGMPFRLRLDPETRTFTETTPDGYDHPACRLSGAQQAMAAVALQMALMDMMRPGMNLYMLDEPTEFLDGPNKTAMAEMFRGMSRIVPSVDGVMLIVTRDAEVVDSCSGVVEVGE